MAKLGKFVVINKSTNEEVDLSDMTRRTVLWLVARSRETSKGRFEVDDIVVDVLEETVPKFHILFQLYMFNSVHTSKYLI